MATAPKVDNEIQCGFAEKAVADAMVEKARSLRAFLQGEAPEGEKRRSPTPAVDKMLKEEGFLRMLLLVLFWAICLVALMTIILLVSILSV